MSPLRSGRLVVRLPLTLTLAVVLWWTCAATTMGTDTEVDMGKTKDTTVRTATDGVSTDRTPAALGSTHRTEVVTGGIDEDEEEKEAGTGRRIPQSRDLRTVYTFPDEDTTAAAAAHATGNPNDMCVINTTPYYSCTNGCPSLFYKVTGGNGSTVTATTCGTSTYYQLYYVWLSRNDTCQGFTCAEGVAMGDCPGEVRSRTVSWTAVAGAEYYLQTWGLDSADRPGGMGTYNLTVSSNDLITVTTANVCGTSHPPPPTRSPTHVPTGAPTIAPTGAPTGPPTDSPTQIPTKAPTKAPSGAADDLCTGAGTTYWLYDPITNVAVRELVNNSATCLLHPYNIGVRPCNVTINTNPVLVRLVDEASGDGGPPTVVYKSQRQTKVPYFLFGPALMGGDAVPSSPKPLRNGNYYVSVKGAPPPGWGRLRFTQNCPCPDGTNRKLGKKGCMK